MLEIFPYYPQIMFHVQASILHKFNISFLISLLLKSRNHEATYV